ncbi:MAG: hypothetical protein GF353_20830 [Candidatus Lokiarchaeota archaeon]|nr:hypothetical protein [Candidatus Lokiarchaeota archaeon]
MSKNLVRIEGINAVMAEKLSFEGIKTIEQVTTTNLNEFCSILDLDIPSAEKIIKSAEDLLLEEEPEKVPPDQELTSKYSMKTTAKRDMDENEEKNT